MKVFTERQISTDGITAKRPALSGLMTRYRSMTKSGATLPEAIERPKVSLRVEDRREDLRQFYEFYESFVEILCDAAQFGIEPKREREYQRNRLEMVNRYTSLRLFVGAYLRKNTEDTRGAAAGICFDAFDALLAPANLELFLQADDGYTISRITRTREALNLYAEHLKQLAERAK